MYGQLNKSQIKYNENALHHHIGVVIMSRLLCKKCAGTIWTDFCHYIAIACAVP